MPPFLHVATIANNLDMYQSMRASMTAAGFDEQHCRFTLFDNSKANEHEPYGVLRQLQTDGDEPYILLCHQDLLFCEQGSFAVLADLIETLNRKDPRWCVAGNAGADTRARPALFIDDPSGNWRASNLPRRAITLDEDLLLLRRSHFPSVTPGLSGFHLYGTDLCLNASKMSRTAYVIPFLVRHLSAGDFTTPQFSAALAAIENAWRPRLLVGLIRTTGTGFIVSRSKFLELLLKKTRLSSLLRHAHLCVIPVSAFVHFFRARFAWKKQVKR
jgi:hypothetical protein